MNKVIRNGKVAVLVSPNHGAGWSTWNNDSEQMIFDPVVVEWVENGKNGNVPIDHYKDRYIYEGGADCLIVEWLPVGTHFRITEYDGYEAVETCEEIIWNIA